MARPAFIQRLEKEKLLTGGNFPEFVDTWNYTVDRVESLKGDRDANPSVGHITVDNADPQHPIIRYVKDMTDGASANLSVVTNVAWDTANYRFVIKGKVLTFKDGLLTGVGENEVLINTIETTPWTGE